MQPLAYRRFRAPEDPSDVMVWEFLPSSQTQDFLIGRSKPGSSRSDGLILKAAHNKDLGRKFLTHPKRSNPGGKVAVPASTSPPV